MMKFVLMSVEDARWVKGYFEGAGAVAPGRLAEVDSWVLEEVAEGEVEVYVGVGSEPTSADCFTLEGTVAEVATLLVAEGFPTHLYE